MQNSSFACLKILHAATSFHFRLAISPPELVFLFCYGLGSRIRARQLPKSPNCDEGVSWYHEICHYLTEADEHLVEAAGHLAVVLVVTLPQGMNRLRLTGRRPGRISIYGGLVVVGTWC
jgi:hypothetical protein